MVKLGRDRMGNEEQAGRFSLRESKEIGQGQNNVAKTQAGWRKLDGDRRVKVQKELTCELCLQELGDSYQSEKKGEEFQARRTTYEKTWRCEKGMIRHFVWMSIVWLGLKLMSTGHLTKQPEFFL